MLAYLVETSNVSPLHSEYQYVTSFEAAYARQAVAASAHLKNIRDQQLNLPGQAPVMVLPDALLFPNSLVPLFIFEPRYRAMLEWSLEQHRMFCVALLKRGIAEWQSRDDFHHVAGIGLVRACVGRPDGTSHLILQGLTRVQFVGFPQENPFIIAEVREIPSAEATTEEGEALSARVLGLCARYRALGLAVPDSFDLQLAEMRDPGALSDIVAHAFIRDPYRRQNVLEKADVAERLRTLIEHLQAELL